ncbi:2-aminoethylphosphonate ABC transporter substrate-binding protein [Paraburkholderia sp. J63]|uniref:2-aminoethylphosphonate ABC transporter substrate-binding protein n=1 Tax=Paraburkholderia sp. J63 TaxID=2805434 RepID=UPI002ABDAA1E|nr:2-aminoethylphosphonate ABC transporter substrate-binding protein [Paraburkholderia sp. J63]
MKTQLIIAAACALSLATASVQAQSNVVTVYAADGLHDGSPSWFGNQFEAFTKATGVKVQYIEAGSSGVVDRLVKEKANVQADVLVTLPPFMQKAAATGMLQPYVPAGADKIAARDRDPKGLYIAMVYDYPSFVYNSAILKNPPKTYADLLAPQFKQKIQYSTPGQAGDGTALMLQVFHAYGSKQAGFDYLHKLQVNNLGPSPSTGKLTSLVNKGELYVANGDIQMNLLQLHDNPNVRMFFPAGPDGKRATFSLPYYIGLVSGAPHSANGKKLIDFLLSAPAQQEVSKLAFGLPARTDVHPTDSNFRAATAVLEGVDIWQPDWNQVLQDLQADIAAYNRAISSE